MAVPGRAYWKGFLRLSLVSIGVAVYNAVDSTSEIKFNQIHKPTGQRINYTKTVKGLGPIDNADIVKAYEIDEDTYVMLEPEELEAIKLESKKTLDLQLLIAAPEVARAEGNTTYRLVRTVTSDGREEVIVSGRRATGEAAQA